MNLVFLLHVVVIYNANWRISIVIKCINDQDFNLVPCKIVRLINKQMNMFTFKYTQLLRL